MNIIGHKYIFLSISCLLVLASVIAIAVWGLKLGVDFKGGSLLEVEFSEVRPSSAEVRVALNSLGLSGALLQPTGDKGFILRFEHTDEETHQNILKVLGSGIREKRFDTIGPTVGQELKRRALMALGLAILAIVAYIAWAFRSVSKPVSLKGEPRALASWKYGVSAVLALVHDITIPAGVFAVLGAFYGVEVDALFITALLTILGFSVHDTIVVFDRIRENLQRLKVPEPYETVVNKSVGETITRSINTSLTVLLVLAAVFLFGGETTRYFALALILGIVFGTYSSIFVASPLLVVWSRLIKKF